MDIELKLPHEIKSEETKRKIMAVTREMLEQYDFKYLTVRNICTKAGVAYGSFYHHFSSKENLLFIYAKELYEEVCEENPLPDWIDEGDYIKQVLWYIVVYGCFCEFMGKEFMKYLLQNCPQNIFDGAFEQNVIPCLNRAVEEGYVIPKMMISGRNNIRNRIAFDLEIVYKGIALWWSCNSENGADAEQLHESLSHLCFNVLYSCCSAKYKESGFPKNVVTDSPNFEGSLKIRGLTIKRHGGPHIVESEDPSKA